jgi:Uroporphyrinogen decarboxylase (URO-D)
VSEVKKECPNVPLVLYINGNGGLLERMVDTGVDVIGLDWTVDMADGRRRLGSKIGIQGNVDPALLFSPLPVLTEDIHRLAFISFIVMSFIILLASLVFNCMNMSFNDHEEQPNEQGMLLLPDFVSGIGQILIPVCMYSHRIVCTLTISSVQVAYNVCIVSAKEKIN